jgi:hypothetical protein
MLAQYFVGCIFHSADQTFSEVVTAFDDPSSYSIVDRLIFLSPAVAQSRGVLRRRNVQPVSQSVNETHKSSFTEPFNFNVATRAGSENTLQASAEDL